MTTTFSSGLTSVIVPCWNQRAFTQICLQALFQHTRPAWELIVVDNGSTDGTGLYLEGVRDAATVPVTVIANAQNLGFPRAINRGLQAACGEYLVLLNNDAVVTDGWLDQMIGLSSMKVETVKETGESHQVGLLSTDNTKNTEGEGENGPAGPEDHGQDARATRSGGTAFQAVNEDPGRDARTSIGLVGPMSNYAAPPQLVEGVPYGDLDAMHDFARRWRDEHRGQWFAAAKLSGFCMLIKRAVYEAIGGLDERFGLGFFDDDDLAVRRAAGRVRAGGGERPVRPPLRQPDVRGERHRRRAAARGERAAVRRQVGS